MRCLIKCPHSASAGMDRCCRAHGLADASRHASGVHLSRCFLTLAISSFFEQALDFVHSSGYVHNDIKPANIMIADIDEPRPRFVLIDFGISEKLSKEARSGLPDGDRITLAPEAVNGYLSRPSSLLYLHTSRFCFCFFRLTMLPSRDIFSLSLTAISMGSLYILPMSGTEYGNLRNGPYAEFASVPALTHLVRYFQPQTV